MAKDKLRYITDEAATTDDFGTHANIATTLLDTIADKDNKPMTIGLEGSWGSGKSTVVNLMFEGIKNGFIESKTDKVTSENDDKESSESQKNENVKNEKWQNIEYFYIDVWQHEHSCIKRAILHEMIESLADKKDKKNRKQFQDIKNKIKGTYSTSNFTALTLLFLSLTILTPFSTEVGIKLYEDGNYFWAFAACLPVISLIIIIFNLLNKNFRKDFYGEKSDDLALAEQVTTTFSNSSIEFKEYFDQILSMIDKEKKTLIVFDNLDRIDEKKAKEMWAELQVFMQYRNPGDRNKEKQTRPWIIIPYDIEGIRKIWGSKIDNQGVETIDKELVKSFLQKTFQARIHVPKPLESNWRVYLELQLKKATKDKDLVAELKGYIESHFIANHKMTPREINTIINQIVIYNNSLTDIIRNRNLCDFVIQKYINLWDDTIFLNQLTSKTGDKTTSLAADESTEDYIKEMAALMYNVSKDESLELFLSKIISNLPDGNKPEYHKNAIVYFAKTHPDSLIDIYFDILSKTSRLQSILLHVEFIQKELTPILKEQTTNLKNAIQLYGADEFHTINLLEEFESINTFFKFYDIDNDNAYLQFVFKYLNQAAKIYNSNEFEISLKYAKFAELNFRLVALLDTKNLLHKSADYIAKLENRIVISALGFYNIYKFHKKNLNMFVKIYSIDINHIISEDIDISSKLLVNNNFDEIFEAYQNLNTTYHIDLYTIFSTWLEISELRSIVDCSTLDLLVKMILADQNRQNLSKKYRQDLLERTPVIWFIMNSIQGIHYTNTSNINLDELRKKLIEIIQIEFPPSAITVPESYRDSMLELLDGVIVKVKHPNNS